MYVAGYMSRGFVNLKRTVPAVDLLPWKSSPDWRPPGMVTTADARAEPARPMQNKLKTFTASVKAEVVADPAVFRLPVHAPLAVHESVPEDDQVRVDVPPRATVFGLAVNVTVRIGPGVALSGSARQEATRRAAPATRRMDRNNLALAKGIEAFFIGDSSRGVWVRRRITLAAWVREM
jgi:hypothetical protein